MSDLATARAELSRRLGIGARFEDPAAPAQVLSWVRSGTAYFARGLNNLQDADFSSPARDTDYRRSYVVAEVSYQARALAQLAEWARTGVFKPQTNPFTKTSEKTDFATTLPAGALRNLFHHSEMHLNVEWRDLKAADWDAVLTLPDGHELTARRATWMRARSIWLKAVDLDNGGSFVDFPADFIDALLEEAAVQWGDADAVFLDPTDRSGLFKLGSGPVAQSVTGRAANLAQWVTGYGPNRLVSLNSLPALPHSLGSTQPMAI